MVIGTAVVCWQSLGQAIMVPWNAGATTNKVGSAAGRRPQPIKVSRWPKAMPEQGIQWLIKEVQQLLI